MSLLKKSAISLVLIMVLLVAFSAVAFANEVAAPDKVYFERAADEKIIVVDYADAIDNVSYGKEALYDAVVTGVTEALKNYLDVWIEVEINGDTYVLEYSEAVKDGLSYDALVADPEQQGEKYVTTAPKPDLEMYLEGVAWVKFRTPIPTAFADWYTVQDSWHKPWELTIVDVIVDENKLGDELGYSIADIEEVRIKGSRATSDSHDRWRVVFNEEIEVEPGDVLFRINGAAHY